MKMPWFRLYHESRNDRKLDILADDEFRVWHKLLCMASEQEERGTITYDDLELLAIEVARGDVTLLSRCVTRLIALRIVTDDGHSMEFLNFMKRNYDKPSETPEATRERKRKSRANAKKTSHDPDGVTRSHAEEEIRVEKMREIVRWGMALTRPRQLIPKWRTSRSRSNGRTEQHAYQPSSPSPTG